MDRRRKAIVVALSLLLALSVAVTLTAAILTVGAPHFGLTMVSLLCANLATFAAMIAATVALRRRSRLGG